MIIKNIIGAGERGLLNYLSQASKSTTNDHINDYPFPLLHKPNTAINIRARLDKSASSFDDLPALSRFNLADRQRRGQVLLHKDAPGDLEPRQAVSARKVRRSSDSGGRTGHEDAPGSVKPFLTNMAGQSVRELSSEITVLRRLRPSLKKAVSHLVLAHDPRQRKLTEKEWEESIKIALQVHGADRAAFAAWRHYDTGDRDHVHIFFARILPSGDVVSDSHNYRKNEAAARQIERTLMLDAPTPTPDEDRPGNRQAYANSARRAERRGTPDPQKINIKKIREALAQAKNHADFLRLLEAMGIEAEFQRRGESQEIYGWKLRQRGVEEWVKASTLHKTLSWPQIKPYFADDVSVRAISSEAPQHQGAVPVVPVSNAASVNRVPAMTRNALARTLPRSASTEQLTAVNQQTEVDLPFSSRLTRLSNHALKLSESRSNLVKLNAVLLRLGVECARFAAGVIDAIFRFIKNLLRLLGVGLQQAQSAPATQNREQPVVPQLEYRPFLLSEGNQNGPVQDVDSVAAEAVQHVVDCISNGRPEDLPEDVPGRAELVAALQAQGRVTAAVAADVAPLDTLFGGHDLAQAARAAGAPTSEQEKPDPFVSLNTAIEQYIEARESVVSARAKESKEVATAQQAHFQARMELEKAQEQHKFEHHHAKIKFLFPAFEKFAAIQISAMSIAEKRLAEAKTKYPPIVPAEVTRAADDQLKSVVGVGLGVIDQLKSMALAHADRAVALQIKGAATALAGSLNDFKATGTTAAAAAVQKTAGEAAVAVTDASVIAMRKVAAQLEDAEAHDRQARSIEQLHDLHDAPRPVL